MTDDQDFRDYTNNSISVLTVQTAVLMRIVEALVATHPKPAELRQHFEHLYVQFQSGPEMLSADQETRDLARQFADRFLPPDTP